MNLKTPVKEADRIFKNYASRLDKLGIKTLEDLLFHFPFRYDDYSLFSKISEIKPGQIVTVRGIIVDIKNIYTKGFKKLQKASVRDESGTIGIIWFNQPFLTKYLHAGENVYLSGKTELFSNKLCLISPVYEIINKEGTNIHTGRLVPVYPETKGVSSKWLRRQVYKLLQTFTNDLSEHIPSLIIERHKLMGLNEAIEQIHFPKSLKKSQEARKRLSFDELFFLQLSRLSKRIKWESNLSNALSVPRYEKEIEKLINKLPFNLTSAQERAVSEIFNDLSSTKPMNRLLEGDVGSGKTVVSAIAMYLSYLNGFQSALLAPTEILAQQHYKTISSLLLNHGVKIELITGKSKTKEMKKGTNIIIGTHAILSEKITFRNLGLVVIDEQQRFGVEQRAIIRKKGKNPHLLTMTATPIPRTVALTLYGDLDLSYLDEMPTGRKEVKTWLIGEEKRLKAYEWIKKQIKETNCGVFIVCPFIEESETLLSIRAAIKEFEKLKTGIFKDFKVGLLHGKLKTEEKDKVINEFKAGKINILIATPVVEVGIDISNAAIIVIEASERFGLAQLHQLRGRVGRGNQQSYCLLFTESKNSKTIEKLKSLENIHIGAKLAELDLKLRGPGEIYGTMQHGLPAFKIASFSDISLIEKTRKEAQEILPNISRYPKLIKKINESDKLISFD